ADIELDVGPAIDAVGGEAVAQLDLRCAAIGIAVGTGAELDDGARLLRARGHDATRAVVLEAAADQRDAVREQRRGERVARVALIAPRVEGEAKAARSVDAA